MLDRLLEARVFGRSAPRMTWTSKAWTRSRSTRCGPIRSPDSDRKNQATSSQKSESPAARRSPSLWVKRCGRDRDDGHARAAGQPRTLLPTTGRAVPTSGGIQLEKKAPTPKRPREGAYDRLRPRGQSTRIQKNMSTSESDAGSGATTVRQGLEMRPPWTNVVGAETRGSGGVVGQKSTRSAERADMRRRSGGSWRPRSLASRPSPGRSLVRPIFILRVRLTQCAVCATELGLSLGKKCGRCSTRYCGPECQVQHWKEGGPRPALQENKKSWWRRAIQRK